MFDFYKNEILRFIGKYITYLLLVVIIITLYFISITKRGFSVRTLELIGKNNDYLDSVSITAFVVFLLILFSVIRTYQFRKIPYTFQFFTRFDEDSKKVYDKFIKKKNGFMIFKNKSGRIDFENYVREQENLMHYFNTDDIVIKRLKKGLVGVKIGDRLPKYIEFDSTKTKDNELYFGEGEDGCISIKTDSLKHTLVAGETGSGKSNVLSVLMMSFIQNLKSGNIEKLILVDLKGNEISVFKPLKKLFKNRIIFAYSLEEVVNLLISCESEFQKRKKVLDKEALSDIYEMKKRVFGNIIFYIDELAQMTLKDDNLFKNDKAYKENYIETQKYLNRFLSLYRAMGFKMILSTQSPRAEVISGLMKSNIPNKLMLKVNSKTNANVIMDSDIYETLQPINPSKFNTGRGILSLDSVNDNQPLLVQIPYISKVEVKKNLGL